MQPTNDLGVTFNNLLNDFKRIFDPANPSAKNPSAADQAILKAYWDPHITVVTPKDRAVSGAENVLQDLIRRAPIKWGPTFNCDATKGEVSGGGLFTDNDGDADNSPVGFTFEYQKNAQGNWILKKAKGTTN